MFGRGLAVRTMRKGAAFQYHRLCASVEQKHTGMSNLMDEEARRQRLRELHDEMTTERRYAVLPEGRNAISGFQGARTTNTAASRIGASQSGRQGRKAKSGLDCALTMSSGPPQKAPLRRPGPLEQMPSHARGHCRFSSHAIGGKLSAGSVGSRESEL